MAPFLALFNLILAYVYKGPPSQAIEVLLSLTHCDKKKCI